MLLIKYLALQILKHLLYMIDPLQPYCKIKTTIGNVKSLRSLCADAVVNMFCCKKTDKY